MFQLGRELKRFFGAETPFAAPRDGLAGRDAGILELLDLNMLRNEAQAADVAAGRVGAKDRPVLQLRQARTWCDLAERTGEADALRKAASAAEAALKVVDRRQRPELWADIRRQQAQCALVGAELYGDGGLAAAADHVLREATEAAPKSEGGALSCVLRTKIAAEAALLRGDGLAAIAAARSLATPIAALDAGQRQRASRRAPAFARLVRAESLAACGMLAKDEQVLEDALADAARATLTLDPAYEPLSWSRAAILRGEILTALGEISADAGVLSRAIEVLASVFDHLPRDHSPLDWARAQIRLGQALAALGEATGHADSLDRARHAFERALVVLRREPGLTLRAAAAQGRAAVIAAYAAQTGDIMALDEAEAAFRCELAAAEPKTDPVGWAIIQMSLAQVYQSRLALTGQDRGERARAAMALDAALEVFSEQGLRSLSAAALDSLDRLRDTV